MYRYLLAGALSLAAMPASAATIIVDAQAHSANNGAGVGLLTGFVFNVGDALTVSSSTDDLWSAGALPRYSDANGLIGDRFATATDDSGQPVGTLIGQDFGLPTINAFTAPFGSLVGRYTDGTYQLLGANFNGTAAGSGALSLFYWDTNFADNFGDIAFEIDGVAGAVPEPATWALMLLGFGLVAGMMRRKKVEANVRYA